MARKRNNFRSDILPEDNKLAVGEIHKTCCDLDLLDSKDTFADCGSKEFASVESLLLPPKNARFDKPHPRFKPQKNPFKIDVTKFMRDGK